MEVRTSGMPPVEFVRQTRAKFQRAARQRIQEYGRAYDAAWKKTLGGASPSSPGQAPGRRTGALQNAGSLSFQEQPAGAAGFRYSMRYTLAPNRRAIAGYLNRGTSRMRARPILDPVLRAAEPEFRRIARLRIGG